jgi:DNA-binding CsgD family transcriptional regulator
MWTNRAFSRTTCKQNQSPGALVVSTAAVLNLSSSHSALSAAERRVIDLLCAGCSNAEIARQLGRKTGTVKNQLSSAYRKLGVRNRTQLVLQFVRAV